MSAPVPVTGVVRHDPVQDSMLRALAVLRFLVLLNAIGFHLFRYRGYAHPLVGWFVLAALTVWTFLVVWAYSAPGRRTPWLLGADLAVAVTAILVTPYVKGPGATATLPGYWVMGVMIAWAVIWRAWGGLGAAVALSLADLSIRDEFNEKVYGNIFLLVIGGIVLGFLSGLLQEMARARDRAEHAAAAAEERQRLSRVVHDGVLQVLALVQRRAPELGPEGAELSRLAGEQEVQLRALVQQHSRAEVAQGEVDLVALLTHLQSRHVHVAVPGGPAVVPTGVGREVIAAVEACLSNVRDHVGTQAPAWVLLEDLGDRLVVSVRDEGPGIAPGRLEAAAAEGRLGVRESIVGRLRDLGGEAVVHTAPGRGTEWELTVPRVRAGEPR